MSVIPVDVQTLSNSVYIMLSHNICW